MQASPTFQKSNPLMYEYVGKVNLPFQKSGSATTFEGAVNVAEYIYYINLF